ncbi:hypothetical protein [Geobacter sp. AOG2]|uniref:hypothetical protein n=1 Tax=Geobacter sp. AOG2 TaxID=1566347 RepID=UPI001CC79C84|nr:hypothetical protein [Geobacter sp. AOG2]
MADKNSSTDIIEASAKACVHPLNRLDYKRKRPSETAWPVIAALFSPKRPDFSVRPFSVHNTVK